MIDFSKPIQLFRQNAWWDIPCFVPCGTSVFFNYSSEEVFYHGFVDGTVQGLPTWKLRNKPPEPVVHRRWTAWYKSAWDGETKIYCGMYHEKPTKESMAYKGYSLLRIDEIMYHEKGE